MVPVDPERLHYVGVGLSANLSDVSYWCTLMMHTVFDFRRAPMGPLQYMLTRQGFANRVELQICSMGV